MTRHSPGSYRHHEQTAGDSRKRHKGERLRISLTGQPGNNRDHLACCTTLVRSFSAYLFRDWKARRVMEPALLEASMPKTGTSHVNSSSPPGHPPLPSHTRIQNRRMGMTPSTDTHRVAVSYIHIHRLVLVLTTLISSSVNNPEYRLLVADLSTNPRAQFTF
jgi:hypothetical protein